MKHSFLGFLRGVLFAGSAASAAWAVGLGYSADVGSFRPELVPNIGCHRFFGDGMLPAWVEFPSTVVAGTDYSLHESSDTTESWS